jgi:hypothetical protein
VTPLLPASESDAPWIELETRHTLIRYPSADILDQFQKSIRFGQGWWASVSSLATFTHEENRKIAVLKTDAIFERAQEILDMKKKMNKVIVMLYPDQTTLEEAYRQTYKNQCRFRAWYEYKTNTISLNVADCHEGVLAHELAHGIIDHYLLVRPPENTAEILARYVDAHLK